MRLFGIDFRSRLSRRNFIRVIHLHPRDNVAVALEDLSEGTVVSIDNKSFILSGFIAAKHKFTLSDIAVGETIYLYGIKVGTASKTYCKRNSHYYGKHC